MKHLISIEDLVLMGCNEEDAICWMAIRKSKGQKILTTTALKLVISEAKKIGWSLAKAVNYSASKGYIGFEASWIKEKDSMGFIERHTQTGWADSLPDNVKRIK